MSTRSLTELHEWVVPTTGPSKEEVVPFHENTKPYDFVTRKPDIVVRVALTSMSEKELREAGLTSGKKVMKRRYYVDRNGVAHNMDVVRIKRQAPEPQPTHLGKMKFRKSWLNPLKKALAVNQMTQINI